MRFSGAEVTIQIKATVIGAETVADVALRDAVEDNNLQLENDSGDRLMSYNTRASKMPWIYKCGKTDTMFKCTLFSAIQKFANSKD